MTTAPDSPLSRASLETLASFLEQPLEDGQFITCVGALRSADKRGLLLLRDDLRDLASDQAMDDDQAVLVKECGEGFELL